MIWLLVVSPSVHTTRITCHSAGVISNPLVILPPLLSFDYNCNSNTIFSRCKAYCWIDFRVELGKLVHCVIFIKGVLT